MNRAVSAIQTPTICFLSELLYPPVFEQDVDCAFRVFHDFEPALMCETELQLLSVFNILAGEEVIVVQQKQLKTIVKSAPEDFGKDPSGYRYEVIFLKEPLSSAKAMGVLSVIESVDFVSAGSRVLYVARPKEKLTQSWLSRLISSAM